MVLLAVFLHREELLDEVLALLVEAELPDTVVLESRTGLELLERDLPIFAGLRSMIPGGIDFSRIVLTVAEDERLARDAMEAIHALEGDEPVPSGEPRNTVLLLPILAVRHF